MNTVSGLGGVIVTLATGNGFTVSVAVPDFPSLVAVIVADPGATPVATPDELTVAAPVLLEPHVTVRPVSTFPWESFVVAVKLCVFPARIEAVAGETVTDATGT
jgi:hypothetical protein